MCIRDSSKYGTLSRPHDNHHNFNLLEEDLVQWDSKNIQPHPDIKDVDFIIAGAAMIGGISYFHKYAYDLLATNERILANTFDLAIRLHKEQNLKRIVVLSSSMVFENTYFYPSAEKDLPKIPPPDSTYGFQKLASEYFAKGAWEQYKLPYTIIRPFNCIGVGEKRALGDVDVMSGNVQLAMSHVVPDLVQKIVKGQDPLHILGKGNQIRHYTYGGDLAEGIRMCIENKRAINEDFNLSTSISTTVLSLACLLYTSDAADE